jgi:hypothetical protein
MVVHRLFIGHNYGKSFSIYFLNSKCIALYSFEKSVFDHGASKSRSRIKESCFVDFFLCRIVRARIELLNLFQEEKCPLLVDIFT